MKFRSINLGSQLQAILQSSAFKNISRNVLTTGVALPSYFAFMYYFTPDQFGLFKVIGDFVGFIEVFTLSGISLTCAMHARKGEVSVAFLLCLFKVALSLVIGAMGLFLVKNFQVYSVAVSPHFSWSMVLCIAAQSLSVINSVYIGMQDHRTLIWTEITSKFLLLGSFLVLKNSLEVADIFVAMTLISALPYLVLYIRVLKITEEAPKVSVFIASLRLALKRSMVSFVPFLETKLDKVIIGVSFLGHQYANYSILRLAYDLQRTVLVGLNDYSIGQMRGDQDEIRSISSLSKTYFLGLSVASIALALGLSLAIYFFLFEKYQDILMYIPLILLPLICSTPGLAFLNWLTIKKYNRYEFVQRVSVSIAYIVFLYYAASRFGLNGVIISLFIKPIMFNIISHIQQKKLLDRFKLSPSDR